MKKILFTLLLLNFYFPNVSAQAPAKLWDAFYNGSLAGKDVANSVITDASGNVYVTGTSFETLAIGNFTTIRYNGGGVEQWADHYSGTQSFATNNGIKSAIDKWQNLYAIGTVALNSGDIAVLKYNTNGKIWSHNYEPYMFGSDVDFGVDICVDSSGNFYATGQVTSLSGNLWDMYVMKCDSAGTKIFEENYSSASGDDYPEGVVVTPGGNFFALTNSFNFFGSQTYDIFTINYLSNGNQNWISRYNGTGNDFDYGTFIKADDAGNQYVCGTEDAGANDDMVVMKQNIYGTRLWVTPYNGSANGNDTAVSAAWLPNGFAVVTGKCKELPGSNTVDAIVTLIIDSGTIVSTNKYYGTDSLGAIPSQMITDAQGNIYVCGYENLNGGTKNGCILKYDSNGNFLWNISYDAGINLDDKFNSIALDLNNDILVTGQTFTSATTSDFVTVKYGNSATGIPESGLTDNILIYPNPVNSTAAILCNISEAKNTVITILDITGKVVKEFATMSLQPGKNKIILDLSSLNNGIYFCKVFSEKNIQTMKLIKN